MLQALHFTTVHRRYDSRIFHKQASTLAALWPNEIGLVVADGKGNETRNGVSIIDVGMLPANRVFRVIQGSWHCFLSARKHKPTVCHFHDPELMPVFLILRLTGVQVVFDAHEDLPKQILTKHWIPRYIRPFLSIAITLGIKLSSRCISRIVAATPKVAQSFPEHKTVVIRNYPIIEASTNNNISEPDYHSRENSFVYVGGLFPQRGTFEMIEAVNKVNENINAKLDLAGVFAPSAHENEAMTQPGWKYTQFHGYIDNQSILALLSKQRAGLVLLHPIQSYIDAYPIKTFEYMAAGIPVISSDFPIYREIIEQSNCGLLVDPLDVGAIVDAMVWILSNPDEAKEMGLRGQKAVRDKYNWQTESSRLLDLYSQFNFKLQN